MEGRRQYARRSGSAYGYFRTHLIPPSGDPPARMPRLGLLQKMANASLGVLDLDTVLLHFLPGLKAKPVRRAKGRKQKRG